MKIEDLLALTKAGWSKEEIIKLSLAEQEAPKEAEENIPLPKEEASAKAPESTTPPRDVLIRNAPGFISCMVSSLII